jgi:hypothetical protein
VSHPTDIELIAWLDGEERSTPEHGEIACHVMACTTCAGLLLAQGDAAYELLRTSWRELTP